VKHSLKHTDWDVVGFNRSTDQRNLRRLDEVFNDKEGNLGERFRLIIGDMADNNAVSGIAEEVDYVVNFGAKTFVDHSIRDVGPFIQSNVVGTYNVLEEARRNYRIDGRLKKFIQVGTDEVYGAILEGAYKEDARLNPTNPYAASKAAGDMLAISYFNTYGLPVVITRTENNFGEWQHPQKAMPKFVKYALDGKKLPIYGDGEHRRMWLYVEDHCSAIMHLIEKGKNGEIYHIAGEQELTNNQLAHKVLEILKLPLNQVEHIDDFNIRPGHDRRYALNVDKIRSLGWNASYKLDESLEKVIMWYSNNQWWLK
jgi:dTDP-glucose 4,6-dehydratase